MSNRKNLLNKIRALMAKTVENGCTEAEAMAALNMAQAMMDAYEVTEEDIKLEDEKATVQETNPRDPHNIKRNMAVMIGMFVDCKVWQSDKTIKFCGLQSDVEFGVWLLETLADFVSNELSWHLITVKHEPENKRWHINGFTLGCINRINQRLTELIKNRTTSVNKNALVIAKQELITRKMNELGLNLRTPRNRSSKTNVDSYAAGKAAGEKASFGRPVGGTVGILRLK